MALQGTLETFALADVLRLLASTKKSGVLRIDGDRGHGEMSVIDGELVGASATGAPRAERPAEVLFELLRYETGSFLFDGDVEVAAGEHPVNVDEALADAEEQLREWREIEAVVPSPTRLVTLVGERDQDITLNPRQWSALVALGGGTTTLDLSERLGVAELPATRLVRDLVELGAVEIGDEAASLVPETSPTVVVSDLPTTLDGVAADDPEVTDPASDGSFGEPAPDALPGDDTDDSLVPAADLPFAERTVGLRAIDLGESSLDPDPLGVEPLDADPLGEPFDADPLGGEPIAAFDDGPGSSLDDILAGGTAPPPPPPPPPPAFAPDDAPLSFADAPSLIDEPPSSPPPPPPVTPLFSNGPAPAAFAPPPPPAFALEADTPAFAAPPPPPPVDPPAGFASAADPLSSWNDDDDDGLGAFHTDDDPVPLFDSSSSAPGPDDPFGPDPFVIPDFSSSPTDAKEAEEAAELARQLANLSPRAQQAVAAAAAAGTDEERDQAIARAEAVSDEPINRSLLLKYLSSVDE